MWHHISNIIQFLSATFLLELRLTFLCYSHTVKRSADFSGFFAVYQRITTYLEIFLASQTTDYFSCFQTLSTYYSQTCLKRPLTGPKVTGRLKQVAVL